LSWVVLNSITCKFKQSRTGGRGEPPRKAALGLTVIFQKLNIRLYNPVKADREKDHGDRKTRPDGNILKIKDTGTKRRQGRMKSSLSERENFSAKNKHKRALDETKHRQFSKRKRWGNHKCTEEDPCHREGGLRKNDPRKSGRERQKKAISRKKTNAGDTGRKSWGNLRVRKRYKRRGKAWARQSDTELFQQGWPAQQDQPQNGGVRDLHCLENIL